MITLEKLKSVLRYDANTGVFTRLIATSNNTHAGGIAGCVGKNGYVYLALFGKKYLAHRLAWFYSTGSWPVGDIDHIDGNRSNNVWGNLREATRSQNLCNMTTPRTNRSGVKGVRWFHRTHKWSAQVQLEGKAKHLGYFANIEDASVAVRNYREKVHGAFAKH